VQGNRGHFVIAVAGASGAGKPELVRALVQALEDTVAPFFDDYHPGRVPGSSYPKNMAQWLAEGANADHWDMPRAIKDCDLVLDGLKPVSELASEAAQQVRSAASSGK
jgi:uridine kinase